MEVELKNSKSETQIMLKLNENRKQQNFEALREWDHSRAHHLMTHRRVAQEIDESLQNKICESEEFLKVVLQFLNDCEQQQKIYESHVLENPESKFRVNPVSKNIHLHTSKCLMRMYKTTQNFKPYKKIKNLLQEGIKQIQHIQSQSEREIMDVRTKLELSIVQIQNANEKTSSKCDMVAGAYKEKTNRLFQGEASDLFLIQQEFLKEAEEQTNIQKKYGQLTVEYLQLVEDLQKKKLELIKTTLQKYLIALSEVRGTNESITALVDILKKKTQDEYLDILYSCEQLLSKELIKEILVLQSRKQSEKLEISEVKQFLNNLGFSNFDNRNLILKEYRSYISHEQTNQDILKNSGESSLLNLSLLISVDHYLHVMINSAEQEISIATQKNTPPDLSINLLVGNSYELTKDGDMALKIGFKPNSSSHLAKLLSLMPQNGKKGSMQFILVIFMSEDQRDEFIEFMEKVTNK